MRSDPPQHWLNDINLQSGAALAWEVVLIEAHDPQLIGAIIRVASAWSAAHFVDERPWFAFAFTSKPIAGVSTYFQHASSDDPEDQNQARSVEMALPLDRCVLTTISFGDFSQRSLVQLSDDPPNEAVMPSLIAQKLNDAGYDGEALGHETDWMFNEVAFATGETGREQVLGWDDLYTDHEWKKLRDADRLYVQMRPDIALMNENQIRDVASIITAERREKFNYDNGPIARDDETDRSTGH